MSMNQQENLDRGSYLNIDSEIENRNIPLNAYNMRDNSQNVNRISKRTAMNVQSLHRPTVQHKRMQETFDHEATTEMITLDGTATEAYNHLENHANQIVSKMEEDPDLMENNVESENLRKEALRHMPQCLTVKRCIKNKLTKSVSKRSKDRPITFYKTIKYRTSIKFSQIQLYINNLVSTFELWYGSLKIIEGHFGSGVGSYFKFLRWLFLLNIVTSIPALVFIVIPQISVRHTDGTSFSFSDIFTGAGSFSNSILYYGFYGNQIYFISSLQYDMRYAYFYTMLFLYVVSFFILAISGAIAYRSNFIETEGGLKNVFAHKIFCGWDYSIATQQAAELKSSAIYHEIKELLSDIDSPSVKLRSLEKLRIFSIRFFMHTFIILLLGSIGFGMWNLLELSENEHIPSVVVAVVANMVFTVIPVVFTQLASFEDYKSARTVLIVSLLRTYILGFIIVGILVAFWMTTASNKESWETSLAQEIYRFILFDFICSVVITVFYISVYVFNKIVRGRTRAYEFDVASHSLEIIYNQSLFWVGLYFSPLLPLVVTIKLFLTWYLRKLFVLNYCKPPSTSWRAAQTQTWFMILTFFSLVLIGTLISYVIFGITVGTKGPFKNYTYIYQILTNGTEYTGAFKYIMYLVKPGVVTMIIIALCIAVYYVREKAIAQRGMVQILRDMLIWESKDKEYLLQYISKVTNGQWQYNMDNRDQDIYQQMPDLEQSRTVNVGDTESYESQDNHRAQHISEASHSQDIRHPDFRGENTNLIIKDADLSAIYKKYS